MAKYSQNEIIWAQHPRYSCLWPAKVLRRSGKALWAVQFLNSKEEACISEQTSKPFNEWGVNEHEVHIDLYNAYRMAAKEYTKNRTTPKDSSEEESVNKTDWDANPEEWTVAKLRDYLNGVMGEREQGRITPDGLAAFPLRPEDSGKYVREGLCQKLNYIIKECPISSELKNSLTQLREAMKGLVMQAFILGEL